MKKCVYSLHAQLGHINIRSYQNMKAVPVSASMFWGLIIDFSPAGKAAG